LEEGVKYKSVDIILGKTVFRNEEEEELYFYFMETFA
jgi:hypothetical protein